MKTLNTSIKSLSQTRWKLEADRVTIYPHGLFYVLSAVLAVAFAAIGFLYVKYDNASLSDAIPLILLLLLVVVLFWGFAGTSVEFDNRSGVMRKKLFGFIPVNSIPFAKLHAINPVTSLYGSYKYRLFRKDAKYGKGIQVSSAYGKNDDPNAIAFVEEAANTIHGFFEKHDSPGDYNPAPITTYRYFNVEGGKYLLKKNKIGSTVLGLVLLAFGIHELTPNAWLDQDMSIGRICLLLFTVLGGPAIILAGFTSVVFDTMKQTVERKSPIGLGNRIYAFDDFNGVQTVRKSMNFIYSGTEVQLYFLKPGTDKQDVMVLQSFFRTSQVERFVQEVHSILNTRY